MKSNRFEFAKHILLLAVGLCFLVGGATTQAADSKLRPGLIVVAKVEGTVQAIDPQGKTTQQLKKSDTLSEKYTVKVGAASSATLAFSNGAVINLLPDTTLVISEFLQDPFASPFSSEELTQEPTTSVTKLQLVQGEIVGTVKKLRTEQGSSLVVNTPVGAAGVRGTTFAISYRNGQCVLSVTEGSVEITDSNGKKTTVSAGFEVVIKNGKVVGEPTRISDAEKNRIDLLAKNGTDASQLIYADLLNQPLTKEWNTFLNSEKINITPKEVTPTNPK